MSMGRNSVTKEMPVIFQEKKGLFKLIKDKNKL